MSKIIKEIIMMLIVCLITLLALAIVLYNYIPNRKVVAEVQAYETPSEIEGLLADDIDSDEKNVILTYEVTSQDLNNYEVKNEYVPGKANPFEAYSSKTTENEDGDITDNTTTNENNEANNSTTNENTENTSFIKDEGTK